MGAGSLALALAACGPPREPQHPPKEPPEPIEPSVPQVSPLSEAASALPVFASRVETTEHFGEPLVGELRLTDGAREPYVRGDELPTGTQIALLVRSPAAAAEESARVLWMEKLDTGWHFDADVGDGRPVDGRRACARCHAEAPKDFVFRIRTP